MLTIDAAQLYRRRLQIIGAAGTIVGDLHFPLTAAARGQLRARIDSILPLREAAQAHLRVKFHQANGKVLLSPLLT